MSQFTARDMHFMERCLYLASLGGYHTRTNPKVGAVIVYDNRIIGEGYHRAYGQPHAEVEALSSIYESDKKHLPTSEMFVTLEPCNHHGKTPPCTNAIIKSGIQKVTICNIDPNPAMSGNSITVLQKKGISVRLGLLSEQGKELNKKFILNHTEKLPYVVLKWAQSKDGFLTKKGEQTWLTNDVSRLAVHRWREELDGILVGTDTAIIDNPKLTNRRQIGTSPERFVLDRNERIPKTHELLCDPHPTFIITTKANYQIPIRKNLIIIDEEQWSLSTILTRILENGCSSLLVEGGRKLLQSLIHEDLWQEARILHSPKKIEEGIKAPHIHGRIKKKMDLSGDKILIINNLNK